MKKQVNIWFIGPFIEHRELLFRFTRRFIERQTKGSLLGLLWLLLNPLLNLALYFVVFGLIMGGDFGVKENSGEFDYALGIFIGLTIMGTVTEAMGQSPFLILSSSNLVQKVVFPLQLLPVALMGSITIRTLASCLLAFVFILLVDTELSMQALWFPVILLPIILFSLGLTWLLSALGVYFRDSQHFMAFLGTALFYASAVFYPASRIPEPIFQYLKYNPVLIAIELARDCLLWQIPVNYSSLAYLYAVALITCIIGYIAFQKLRAGFADVL